MERTFLLQPSFIAAERTFLSVTHTQKSGFTGSFNLFWSQSVQLKRDHLQLYWKCFYFPCFRCTRSCCCCCSLSTIGRMGLPIILPLSSYISLPACNYASSTETLYIKLSSSYRGKEFEHYFILYGIIDLVSMNPGTKFRFVFH